MGGHDKCSRRLGSVSHFGECVPCDSGLCTPLESFRPSDSVSMSMTLTRRSIYGAATIVVILSVLWDPYTFFRDASDLVIRAPLWQVAAGLIDLVFLSAVAWSFWRGMIQRAAQLLMFETIYSLALSIGFVMRDGLDRYIRGIGAQEFLSVYLLMIIIRVVLIYSASRDVSVLSESTKTI